MLTSEAIKINFHDSHQCINSFINFRFIDSCWWWIWKKFCSPRELQARTVHIGRPCDEKYPRNEIRNQVRAYACVNRKHDEVNITKRIPILIFPISRLCFSEIFRTFISSTRALPTVQILLKFIFFNHGTKSIHSRRTSQLFVHILGTIGFRADGDNMSRGCRRFSSAST